MLYLSLIVLVLVFVLPLVWAAASSFKLRGDIFAYPPKLFPEHPTLHNYQTLLAEQPFWGWFAMSTVVALISTAVSVFVCSLAGFGFAKYRFKGKNFLFNVMFSSLAIPFAVIVVPLFIMLVRTGLNSPYFALIVPWVAPAFGIFMMRQFTEQSIPDELLESGRVDGCGEFMIFWTIVLPLLRPALGALAVWSFINSYNAFLWPLIIVGEPSQYTLPLGLGALFATENRQYDLVLAGSVLAAIPSLLLFIGLRKQLIDGLTAGAVKS
ncbi:carbohydrate ABC transporter permease [Kribbella amoyensis]|uniref:carbohydrate ABC transporter permease n=1 Tax=Kribbella amoyensis TaxID=996641 RepID=UPI00192DB2A8|nr:carbohydrate ABC transporter permease [Kribbella amoyensis]